MVNFMRFAGLVALAPLVAAMPATSSSSPMSLEKRAITCNDKDVATASDAAACIDQLAARGDEECRAEYTGATNLCTIGNAQIVSVAGVAGGTSSACRDVARALGAIMDQCWRADGTVQGQNTAWGNGNMAIHISAPLI